MNKFFEETSIGNEYAQALFAAEKFTVPDSVALYTINAFIKATAIFLRDRKRKDNSVGLKLADTKGNFLFGAVVKYIVNEEDPDMPGNWELTYMMKEEDFHADIEELATETSFITCLARVAERDNGMKFTSMPYIPIMCIQLFRSIINNLTVNVDENEEYSVTVKESCVFTAVVEDDHKVISCVPDEVIKQVIKDDAGSEIL